MWPRFRKKVGICLLNHSLPYPWFVAAWREKYSGEIKLWSRIAISAFLLMMVGGFWGSGCGSHIFLLVKSPCMCIGSVGWVRGLPMSTVNVAMFLVISDISWALIESLVDESFMVSSHIMPRSAITFRVSPVRGGLMGCRFGLWLCRLVESPPSACLVVSGFGVVLVKG